MAPFASGLEASLLTHAMHATVCLAIIRRVMTVYYLVISIFDLIPVPSALFPLLLLV